MVALHNSNFLCIIYIVVFIGIQNYNGLMQDAYLYSQALTERSGDITKLTTTPLFIIIGKSKNFSRPIFHTFT